MENVKHITMEKLCYGKLLFNGVYLYKDKLIRKGKEYGSRYGKLIFEGEYLNGKRWNGNGYDIQNNIIYQIKNGKGYAKEYYYNDFILLAEIKNLNDEISNINEKLKFEGEYLGNKRNGKCKEYSLKGDLIFEGEYINESKNGKCNIIWPLSISYS